MTLTVSKARLRLSELVRRAESGEEIRIARYNGPTSVRLVAEPAGRPKPLAIGCPGARPADDEPAFTSWNAA